MSKTYTLKEVKSLCKKAYDDGFTCGHYDEQEKTAEMWIGENIKEKVSKPKVKTSYNMTVYYMIGDADGNTEKKETISANNPFLMLVSDALEKLEAPKGRWGISLDSDNTYNWNFKSKKINKLEYDLLSFVSGYGCDEEDKKVIKFLKENGFEANEENFNFLNEFQGLFINETAYSFLTYEGHKLK